MLTPLQTKKLTNLFNLYDADGNGAGSSMIALAHLETGTVTASDVKIA